MHKQKKISAVNTPVDIRVRVPVLLLHNLEQCLNPEILLRLSVRDLLELQQQVKVLLDPFRGELQRIISEQIAEMQKSAGEQNPGQQNPEKSTS